MKLSVIFISVFSILSLNLYPQTLPEPYEVGTWSGFRSAAINYTFDDGCPNQFNIAIPLFDEFGFKLTLFTVTSWITDWSNLEAAAANGHEVASHTVNHPNFNDITVELEQEELAGSKSMIEQHISVPECITMAYPYCVPGTDSICGKYYLSARGCQGFIEPKTPGSYMNISSIICGSLGSVKTLQNFKDKFNSAADMKGWCVFLFHGIDDDGGYSPIASEELRKSIEYLSPRSSKFWLTTFANATLYAKERDVVQVSEIAATDTSMTLLVMDTLPDSVYHFPLSLRRPLPPDWPSADVFQDTIAVPMRIVQVDTVVYLSFEVIPDAGEVKISRNMTPVVPEVDTIPPDDPEPEPEVFLQSPKDHIEIQAFYSKGSLMISIKDQSISEWSVHLYDTRGTELLTRKLNCTTETDHFIDLNADPISAGVYLVYLTSGRRSWSRKIFVS